jgi:glycosyltransferase A (GT-A) superfamily protein (DUF2064 family)
MNRDTMILMTGICGARRGVDLGLALIPDRDEAPYAPYLAAGFSLISQRGKTRAERTLSVLRAAFDTGYRSAVLLLPGVPNLPPRFVERALTRLRDRSSLVMGPLNNGTFYLIGERADAFGMIHDDMHLEQALDSPSPFSDHLLDRLKAAGIRWTILPEWYRIRSAGDLKRLKADSRNGRGHMARWTRGVSSRLLET